jgi:DNA-directed RNA polymerase subunit M/transcription elongation factor TFIIS
MSEALLKATGHNERRNLATLVVLAPELRAQNHMSTSEFFRFSPRQAKEVCVAHLCPSCGTEHHITVEQVLSGDKTVTLCHCRACGHSWHPVVKETRES